MKNAFSVDHLADDELLRRTGELAVRGKRIDAALIAHMAEVDHRKLYRGQACSSMFAYAVQRLRLSESQAYERITVARRAREFPLLLEMLADGRLTLTAAAKLGPHLTSDNAAALLARAVHATRREVELLVAEVAPRPDVASSVRKLPTRAPATQRPAHAVGPAGVVGGVMGPAGEVRPAGVVGGHMGPADAVGPDVPVSARPRVEPISPARYRVQFTASAKLEAKIARARALLRHKFPSGDIVAVVDEAMTLLVDRLERRRCGKAERPRANAPTASASRHVPAAARRVVWQRDGGRCTFVDRQGLRCRVREALEIHHVDPFGKGGETCVANLRLLCRTHNQFQAELDYGIELVAARRSGAREPRRPYECGSAPPCDRRRVANQDAALFSKTSSGRLRDSTTERSTTHSLTPSSDGISYMTSSISSSRMARRPRAPDLRR